MKTCSPDRQMYTVRAHRLVLNFLTETNHREYRTSGGHCAMDFQSFLSRKKSMKYVLVIYVWSSGTYTPTTFAREFYDFFYL